MKRHSLDPHICAGTSLAAARNCAIAESTDSPPDRSSSAPALWPTAGYPPALPQSGPLQYLMRRDPVHSRAFHRHRYYVSRQQPGRHPFQLWRGRSERFHLPSRPTQLRRTHLMLLASQIDPRYVGSNHWEPFAFHMAVRLAGFSTIFSPPVIRLPNTTAQVARHSDSGLALGESYRSLANVQLPSRSHAVFGAYAPMEKGL